LHIDDFDYSLPEALIAQFPPERRGDSRLLTLDAASGALADRRFSDLPELLSPGDVLVFNDTRVLKARLFGEKATGGKVELLIERVTAEHEALALVRASHLPKAGSTLTLDGGIGVHVLERQDNLFRLQFITRESVLEVLDRHGALPLPPYIERAPQAQDEGRYQTVYARTPGAVAAPTAGLHFDEAMLGRLRARGTKLLFLTLHVGAGTFLPVRAGRIEEHRMHSEHYTIPPDTVAGIRGARAAGGRVVAVGTTSLRALEAAARDGALEAGSGDTELFITPGYPFRIVDRLITNFHLPRSTLLMLVAAFGGLDNIRRAYAHAVSQAYRFFSYGDAMLIDGGGEMGNAAPVRGAHEAR
jgi:S-adenosylmethionine:tRNA ribosyltransferase-isomerase